MTYYFYYRTYRVGIINHGYTLKQDRHTTRRVFNYPESRKDTAIRHVNSLLYYRMNEAKDDLLYKFNIEWYKPIPKGWLLVSYKQAPKEEKYQWEQGRIIFVDEMNTTIPDRKSVV